MYAAARQRAEQLVALLWSWRPGHGGIRMPHIGAPHWPALRQLHRACGLAVVLLALAALSPPSILTLVLMPESDVSLAPGGILQTIALATTLAAILWLLVINGRLGEQLEEARHAMPEAGAAVSEAEARQRELEATIAELKDWRMRLERQGQLLAAAVDRSMQEKSVIERHCQAKSERLVRAGHELRTPLNAVIGFSELMLGEVFGPIGHDKYLDYVHHIRDSGRRLLDAAHDILELAGSGPTTLAETAPAAPRTAAMPGVDDSYARIAASLQAA